MATPMRPAAPAPWRRRRSCRVGSQPLLNSSSGGDPKRVSACCERRPSHLGYGARGGIVSAPVPELMLKAEILFHPRLVTYRNRPVGSVVTTEGLVPPATAQPITTTVLPLAS